MRKLLVLLGYISLLVPVTGIADEQSCLKAALAHQGSLVVKECTPLAENGDLTAQYNLAVIYHLGAGIPKNPSLALKWFTEAAKQGNKDAQFNVGFMYYYKESGIPQDYAYALKWFTKAEEQRDKRAPFYIGAMHYHGQGVPQSYKQAMYWFEQAALRGYLTAQLNMSAAYGKGEGLPESLPHAYAWYRIALENGHKDEVAGIRRNVFSSITHPDGRQEQRPLKPDTPILKSTYMEKEMTPEERDQAEALIKELKQKIAATSKP